MQIENVIITTPIDNPVQYAPDWRSRIAAVFAERPRIRLPYEYAEYHDDPAIVSHADYLRESVGGRMLSKAHKRHRLASTWFQGNRTMDTRFRLEPLLLTPIGFDVISLDVGGGTVDPEVFRLYERLFFNVRTASGMMHPSCHLRTYFATPDGPPGPTSPTEVIWRSVGANLGYDALASMWLWSDAHGLSNRDPGYLLQEMWRVSQAMALGDIYSHRVNHMDLSMLMGRITDHERMRHETNSGTGEGAETTKVLMGILALAKPELILAAKTVDKQTILDQSIRDRVLSQRNVHKQDVTDLGVEAGHEAVMAMLEQRVQEQTQKETE